MPLYEYHCRGCDKPVELLVRRPEEKPVCPECGADQLAKLLSVPAGHTASTHGDREPPEGPCGSACGCFPQD